ncbi:hypothetical protein HOLleu_29287 [Holothuria leucospilota]|uniref:Uncharacterized protein n=1 Tax=Holothuria leucospilota TaxID=206669 RepID=A0A9Q1BN88_HOLLE|nr:hypothetical protein HOLleu_29287 [Holothuria leucospilota]
MFCNLLVNVLIDHTSRAKLMFSFIWVHQLCYIILLPASFCSVAVKRDLEFLKHWFVFLADCLTSKHCPT